MRLPKEKGKWSVPEEVYTKSAKEAYENIGQLEWRQCDSLTCGGWFEIPAKVNVDAFLELSLTKNGYLTTVTENPWFCDRCTQAREGPGSLLEDGKPHVCDWCKKNGLERCNEKQHSGRVWEDDIHDDDHVVASGFRTPMYWRLGLKTRMTDDTAYKVAHVHKPGNVCDYWLDRKDRFTRHLQQRPSECKCQEVEEWQHLWQRGRSGEVVPTECFSEMWSSKTNDRIRKMVLRVHSNMAAYLLQNMPMDPGEDKDIGGLPPLWSNLSSDDRQNLAAYARFVQSGYVESRVAFKRSRKGKEEEESEAGLPDTTNSDLQLKRVSPRSRKRTYPTDPGPGLDDPEADAYGDEMGVRENGGAGLPGVSTHEAEQPELQQQQAMQVEQAGPSGAHASTESSPRTQAKKIRLSRKGVAKRTAPVQEDRSLQLRDGLKRGGWVGVGVGVSGGTESTYQLPTLLEKSRAANPLTPSNANGGSVDDMVDAACSAAARALAAASRSSRQTGSAAAAAAQPIPKPPTPVVRTIPYASPLESEPKTASHQAAAAAANGGGTSHSLAIRLQGSSDGYARIREGVQMLVEEETMRLRGQMGDVKEKLAVKSQQLLEMEMNNFRANQKLQEKEKEITRLRNQVDSLKRDLNQEKRARSREREESQRARQPQEAPLSSLYTQEAEAVEGLKGLRNQVNIEQPESTAVSDAPTSAPMCDAPAPPDVGSAPDAAYGAAVPASEHAGNAPTSLHLSNPLISVHGGNAPTSAHVVDASPSGPHVYIIPGVPRLVAQGSMLPEAVLSAAVGENMAPQAVSLRGIKEEAVEHANYGHLSPV